MHATKRWKKGERCQGGKRNLEGFSVKADYFDPGWEAISRKIEDSKLKMHHSIKARTGQSSVKGELEVATCAILA